jgi:hypothetical protein
VTVKALTFALAVLIAGCAPGPITEKSVLKEVVTVTTTTGHNDGVGVTVIREERALHSVCERVEVVGGE